MAHIKNEGTEILRVLCGSRAHGLETEDSDWDYHSVFVVPTKRLLEINVNVKETAWVEGDTEDNTAWEIGHFLKLATHCNPTILETFVAPVIEEHTNKHGLALREMFPYVLKRKAIYDAFKGYAANQRKKMFEPYGEDKERRMIKAAIAYIRSLYHGRALLRYGKYETYIADNNLRVWLKNLKTLERLPHGEVITRALDMEEHLTWAYKTSMVREEPDIVACNEFLLKIRRWYWE